MSRCVSQFISARNGLAVLAILVLPFVSNAVSISEAQAGNVTPFSFMVAWQVSGDNVPAMEIFSDSEGTGLITDTLTLEFYPLHTGDRAVVSDYAGRQERSALQTEMEGRGIVLVRVTGAEPGTTYYARPFATNESGDNITSNGPVALVPVSTALENAFIEESRQLVIGFSGSSPELSYGSLARVSVEGLPYPLFSVVGDGGSSTEAFFNLDNLLDAAGLSNLNPASPVDLEITLLGNNVTQGTMDYSVPYGGGFVTADAVVAPYSPVAAVVDSFVFDPIGAQQVGTSFTVTIRALDASGKPLTGYAGTVEIASNLNLAEGAGTTPAFSDGVLSSYPVTVAESGQAQLSATETGGTAAGTSNTFDVASIVWTLTTEAVPAAGGTVTGGGTYADGSSAVITATPANRYVFEGWNGIGIDNPDSSSTSVLMNADKTVTALFVEDAIIQDYAEWSRKLFGEDPPEPELTVPEQDYDLDGISNLFEYATGGDPLVRDRDQSAPASSIDPSGAPVFTFTRRNSSEDLEYLIQVSTLDGVWSTYTPAEEDIVVTDLGDGLEQVQVTLSDRTNVPSFIRLVVTLRQ